MLQRRDFLKSSLFLLSALRLNSPANTLKLKQKPNILWIVCEDAGPDLGCYGNTIIKTPNLDKLAAEGVLYKHAFTTSPVCSPSRSAFMTGMYQTSINAHHHRSHINGDNPLPEPVKVITEFFNNNGYNAFYRGKTDVNFCHDIVSDEQDWFTDPANQPFFGVINLLNVHRPFVRDKNNPIPHEKVSPPPYYPDHPVVKRDWADYLEALQVLDSEVGQILDKLDKSGLKENTVVFFFADHGRAHLRCKQWLYDGGIQVPLIIRHPDSTRRAVTEDRLVSAIDFYPTALAMADIDIPNHLHGCNFWQTKHQRDYIIAARDRCDESVDRVRCVRSKEFKYIRNYMPNKPYTQFNAYKELSYPALPVMRKLNDKGQLTEAQQHFMADSKPKEELYDLKKDPYELTNLAKNSNYQNTIVKYRTLLKRWENETNDQGRYPEDPAVIQYWKEVMQNFYKDAVN